MNRAARRLALLLVLGTAGLLAPSAQAASVSFDRPCYRNGLANLTVSGLPADSPFALWQQDPLTYPDFGYIDDLYSDAAGTATYARSVPDLGDSLSVVATFSVRSQDTEVANGQVRLTGLGATPEIVGYRNTAGTINLAAYGFVEGGTLYGHYVYKRKHFKTIAIGPLKGPCGALEKKIAKFPFRPVKKGEWWIQFDNRRTYQRQVYPFVENLTSVTKTVPKKCKRNRGQRCARR